MTINQLIKKLEKLRDEHGKRLPVCCNAREMLDSCNGVFQILDVSEVKVDSILQADGDGFIETTARGLEKSRVCVVLS